MRFIKETHFKWKWIRCPQSRNMRFFIYSSSVQTLSIFWKTQKENPFTCSFRKCSPIIISKTTNVRNQYMVFVCTPFPLLQSHLNTASIHHGFLVLVKQVSIQIPQLMEFRQEPPTPFYIEHSLPTTLLKEKSNFRR